MPHTYKQRTAISDKAFKLDRVKTMDSSVLGDMSEGEKIFYQKCTLCHAPRDPAAHTIKEWKSITKSMFINAGATPRERELIIDFLSKNAKDAVK